jgi:hypothetical protein
VTGSAEYHAPTMQTSINRSMAMPVKYCKTISSALENEGLPLKMIWLRC